MLEPRYIAKGIHCSEESLLKQYPSGIPPFVDKVYLAGAVQDTIADLQGQVDQLSADVTEARYAQTRAEERVQVLRDENASLTQQVQTASENMTENSKLYVALQQRVAQLEAGVNVCRERYDKLSTAHGTLQADHARVLGLVQDLLHPTKSAVERQRVLDALAASLPAQPAQGGA